MEKPFAKMMAAAAGMRDLDHVADIDDMKVLLHSGTDYLLTADDTPVAFFRVIKEDVGCLLQIAYVVPEHRMKKILERFLWFLKTREGFSPIKLGDVHTDNMVGSLKSLSKRFKISWVGRNDGSVTTYDQDTADLFYVGPGEERTHDVLLDCAGDWSDWGRFNSPDGIDPPSMFYMEFFEE